MRSGCLAITVAALALACSSDSQLESALELEYPPLTPAGEYWLAARLFANETGGEPRYLTHWGEGEDFPSFGIGHFIWFPKGVDAPFDETFPAFVDWMTVNRSPCEPMPDWLQQLQPLDAPWQSKTAFDEQQSSARMQLLRDWLAATAVQQLRFVTERFIQRWNSLPIAAHDAGLDKQQLTALLQQLIQTPQGLYAVSDYYNFKGLGSNPRERYNGEGWGLLQVLADVQRNGVPADPAALLAAFSEAAENRLRRRVSNAPVERNEQRWIPGWAARLSTYTEISPKMPEMAEVGQAQDVFRVAPYLRDPSAGGITVQWYSVKPTPGELTVQGDALQQHLSSSPELACELAYGLPEFGAVPAADLPYRHEVRVEDLMPGRHYRYTVNQDGERRGGEFRTPLANAGEVRFIVFGDSETEPESTGKFAPWPRPADTERRYPVDQTRGFQENLRMIAARKPDFVAIAGDLVESGGEQRDWDEFWRHLQTLGHSTPLVAARGNHEYFGGPGPHGGYSVSAARRAIEKFRSYFGKQDWFVLDYGPLALLVLDVNNGTPERSENDTNWHLQGDVAPLWQPGSAQWQWLQQSLAEAQNGKQFTFVLFHAAPYTSGVHGREPGIGKGKNFSSGVPLQTLTPLFMQYGVDAVFTGHDEMYEHSAVHGEEQTADGRRKHTLHFVTVGIGGDGLRGPDSGMENPQSVFLAHTDAPESYAANGVLRAGGKHYGHAEVSVREVRPGYWQAGIETAYAFPLLTEDGFVTGFERRVYDDRIRLEHGSDH